MTAGQSMVYEESEYESPTNQDVISREVKEIGDDTFPEHLAKFIRIEDVDVHGLVLQIRKSSWMSC
ncbi:hypothetical protein D9758_013315 [Tetrapyrgos nigripes]|uniref:Uncharacterized protein n=1 Tax=Tetrapyrgos nigripes TaxID=182062 RepID=A0A8H5CD37_9AGAR|nr:hypothetical protein D9758_013315 [Tetrapyrgos nigripes]